MFKDEEKDRFRKNLFEFLRSRGVANLKVPQIGGKELDLFELYQSVIRRGGAQKVSNLKLWKEIVNEFDLPPSCTSASYTMKSHYQKYLLAYEQKFYFGKGEEEMIKELGSSRQKRSKAEDSWKKPQTHQIRKAFYLDSNMEQSLINHYKHKIKKNADILYVKRSRMTPFSGEIRRIVLAFESQLQDEVRFALNNLLLYSCSESSPLLIEQNEIIFEGLWSYTEEIIDKVPHLFSSQYQDLTSIASKEVSVFSHYNYSSGYLTKNSSRRPFEIIKESKKQMITMKYEEITVNEILEQVRIS